MPLRQLSTALLLLLAGIFSCWPVPLAAQEIAEAEPIVADTIGSNKLTAQDLQGEWYLNGQPERMYRECKYCKLVFDGAGGVERTISEARYGDEKTETVSGTYHLLDNTLAIAFEEGESNSKRVYDIEIRDVKCFDGRVTQLSLSYELESSHGPYEVSKIYYRFGEFVAEDVQGNEIPHNLIRENKEPADNIELTVLGSWIRCTRVGVETYEYSTYKFFNDGRYVFNYVRKDEHSLWSSVLRQSTGSFEREQSNLVFEKESGEPSTIRYVLLENELLCLFHNNVPQFYKRHNPIVGNWVGINRDQSQYLYLQFNKNGSMSFGQKPITDDHNPSIHDHNPSIHDHDPQYGAGFRLENEAIVLTSKADATAPDFVEGDSTTLKFEIDSDGRLLIFFDEEPIRFTRSYQPIK